MLIDGVERPVGEPHLVSVILDLCETNRLPCSQSGVLLVDCVAGIIFPSGIRRRDVVQVIGPTFRFLIRAFQNLDLIPDIQEDMIEPDAVGMIFNDDLPATRGA